MPLLRPQAIEHRRRKIHGEVMIAQPVGLGFMTAVFVLSTLLLGFFMVRAEFARKETIPGWLEPERGPVNVCQNQNYDQIIVVGQTLCFKGMIKPQSELVRVLKTSNVSTLVINSSGGYAEPALDAALIIYQKNIDVYVDGVCGSSCANYIFLAGRYKFVTKNSTVFWHGSPHNNSEIKANPSGWTDEEVHMFNKRLRRTKSKQSKLLRTIGVSPDLLDSPGSAFFRNPIVEEQGWTVDDIQSEAMLGKFAWTVGPKRLKKDYGVKGIKQMWYSDAKTLYDLGTSVFGGGFFLIALSEPSSVD
jgi:hypothetical protein